MIPKVLTDEDIVRLRAVIDGIAAGEAVRRKKDVYGVRNLLELCPDVCEVATRSKVWRFVTPVLGASAFATRAILFNKTPLANWALGWHQDRVIAVANKIETPGFKGWGRKAGVWHVQPPSTFLSRMLALRIHLDDCGAENGALRIIPGSHNNGWLDDEVAAWKCRIPAVTCSVPAGGVVAMCPMTLHASSRALTPSNRRVIHIEYVNEQLPNGLRWNRRIRPMHCSGNSIRLS